MHFPGNKAYILFRENEKTEVVIPNINYSWRSLMSNMLDIDPFGVTILTRYCPKLTDGLITNKTYKLIAQSLPVDSNTNATFFLLNLLKSDKTITGWCSNDHNIRKEEGLGLMKTYFLQWYKEMNDRYTIDFPILTNEFIKNN